MSEQSISKAEAPAIDGSAVGVTSQKEKETLFSELEAEQAPKSPDDKGTSGEEGVETEVPEKSEEEPAPEVEEPSKEEAPAEEQAEETEEDEEIDDPVAYITKTKKLDPKDPEAFAKLAKMYVHSEKFAKKSKREQSEIVKRIDELQARLEQPKEERTVQDEEKIKEMKKEMNERFWKAFDEDPIGAIAALATLVVDKREEPRKLQADQEEVDKQIRHIEESYGKKLIAAGQADTWKQVKLRAAKFIKDNPEIMNKPNAIDYATKQVFGEMLASGEIANIFGKGTPKKPAPAPLNGKGGNPPRVIDKGKKSPEDEILEGIVAVGDKRNRLLNF